MNRNFRRQEGPGALETVEAAVHLLRSAPVATLATYYAGGLPFVLGFLYFWADMSRSPFAAQHAVAASLGLAVLFVWFKFWQALFARKLRAQLSGETPARLALARAGRILFTQMALQPTALIVLPLAMVLALPFPWLYAFYQSLTTQAEADTPTLRATIARSWRLALLWPAQNHVIFAVVGLFSFFVFLSLTIAGAMLPELFKIIFGIESVFTRGGEAMLNTTFFATIFGLTFLCVDPILKAVYVVRVFQGESLRSGEDLRAALKPFAPVAAKLVVGLVALLTFANTPSLQAQAADSGPQPNEPIQPRELDRAIDEVIQKRKYTWRAPRERVVEEPAGGEPGVIVKFFQRVGSMFRNALRTVGTWIEKVLRRIFGRFGPTPGSSDYSWIMTKQMLLYGLLAVVLSAIAVLLIRFWKKRQKGIPIMTAQAVQPAPDLADENIGADQLPEDGWTILARELLGRGELRLALRAFYLASLAHLAERNLVSLARFKSNRDYQLELQRRAHAFPNLQSLFGENVSSFDRVWYGQHEATGELVTRFAANVERIRSGA